MDLVGPDPKRARLSPHESRQVSELTRSLSAAAARVDELIREAQSVAEQVCADAEREAERHLAESRREAERLLSRQRGLIGDLFSSLRDDLDAAERRAAAAVEAALRELPPVGRAAPSRPQSSPPAPDGPTMVSQSDAGVEGRRDPEGTGARALVRAAQLAAMGRERAEIEMVLRDEFGLERPGETIDRVLPG